MKITRKKVKLKQLFCLVVYYGVAQYLPKSGSYGNVGGVIRRFLCKQESLGNVVRV